MGLRADAHRGFLLTALRGESGLTAELQRGFLWGDMVGDMAEKGLPGCESSKGTLMSCSISSTAAISCQLPADMLSLLLHTTAWLCVRHRPSMRM